MVPRALQPDELFRAAQARASSLPRPPGGPEAALERLRTEVLALLARVPEPPLYQRAEDPARRQAQALLGEVEEALAHALALARVPAAAPAVAPLVEALWAHAEGLCHTLDGRLARAEEAWQRGREKERQASRSGALLERRRVLPAFERSSGRSRYDPQEAPEAGVKLVCPNTGCRRVDDYLLHPAHTTHRFVCRACNTPFLAYFAQVRRLEVQPARGGRRYSFLLDELGGAAARVEFDEASGADFGAAPQDLLAFLYTETRELKVVVNLASGRMMWVSSTRACFVATVTLGEGAGELEAFRALRDEVLRKSVLGRAFIRGYYRWGPGLAQQVAARPRVRRWVRRALRALHRQLTRSGRA